MAKSGPAVGLSGLLVYVLSLDITQPNEGTDGHLRNRGILSTHRQRVGSVLRSKSVMSNAEQQQALLGT